MPNYVSPGVYVIEKDISEYAPSINTSIVGLVGFAGKGPTNKATLITSQNQLIDTFGPPSENLPGQALEGALEILGQTNSVYFSRAAASTAADASASVTLGSCPAVIVSGPPSNAYTASPNNDGSGWGIDHSLYLRVQVYNNAGVAQYPTAKTFSIPAGTVVAATSGASQALALKQVIGGNLDADKVGIYNDGQEQAGLDISGALVGAYAGSGAYMVVQSYSGAAMTDVLGTSALAQVSGLVPGAGYGVDLKPGGVENQFMFASSVSAYGSTILPTATSTSSLQYLVESIYPGAGYNAGTTTGGDTSGNSVTVRTAGGQNFFVDINDAGVVSESFKASLVGSGVFLEDQINTGETDLTSDIIKGNLYSDSLDIAATALNQWTDVLNNLVGFTVGNAGAGCCGATTQYQDPNITPGTTSTPFYAKTTTPLTGADPRFVKLVEGTNNLAGGDNGTGDDAANVTALIGDATTEPKTGMQVLAEDAINVGIALIPGIYNQSVQNNLVTMAESTQNFLALVAPPYGIGTVQDAIDWTNGKSASTAGSRTAALNSSYAATYFPHLKVFSVFDSKDRWYDPTIFAARQMAYTDNVADSWFAPAGYQRGRLTKPVDTEVKLNQGDRDSLYSGGNVINPIVSFPQQGITIFGQRTTQRSPTALDRINVRRLMIYIRKVILAATRRFVFEPNDEFTWEQIEGVLNPFLDDIRRRRGITEFRVVCDKTVNTPVRIDRNEMWTKVLVKPTKTAEILIFEVNLTNQSAQLGNL